MHGRVARLRLIVDTFPGGSSLALPRRRDWHAGAFEVLRFGRETTVRLQLTIDPQELWGTWDLIGQAALHHIRDQTRQDEQIVLTHDVTTGHNVFREPAPLLIPNRPIVIATIGDRFAFKRELAQTD